MINPNFYIVNYLEGNVKPFRTPVLETGINNPGPVVVCRGSNPDRDFFNGGKFSNPNLSPFLDKSAPQHQLTLRQFSACFLVAAEGYTAKVALALVREARDDILRVGLSKTIRKWAHFINLVSWQRRR